MRSRWQHNCFGSALLVFLSQYSLHFTFAFDRRASRLQATQRQGLDEVGPFNACDTVGAFAQFIAIVTPQFRQAIQPAL